MPAQRVSLGESHDECVIVTCTGGTHSWRRGLSVPGDFSVIKDYLDINQERLSCTIWMIFREVLLPSVVLLEIYKLQKLNQLRLEVAVSYLLGACLAGAGILFQKFLSTDYSLNPSNPRATRNGPILSYLQKTLRK